MKIFVGLQINENNHEITLIGINEIEEGALKRANKNLPHKAFDIMRNTSIVKEDIELWLSENGLTALEMKHIIVNIFKIILKAIK